MKKVSMLLLCLLASIMGAKAQIGYQIALLNTATGEARANETVVVSVSLSNSANEVFYSETKSATTNDFGVLSLTIGNADTFANVDLNKMPFFIEVKANGVLIGKSQMLSVPVAEVAKKVAPMDKSLIVGTWIPEYATEYTKDGYYSYTFNNDATCTITSYGYNYENNSFYIIKSGTANYIVEGTNVYITGRMDYYGLSAGYTFFKYYDGNLLIEWIKYIKQ